MQINSSLVPLEEHNSVLDNPKKTSINDVHQLDIEILFFYFFLLPSL